MKIVLPFTKIKPGVREALEETGWPWEEVDVSGDDDAYFRLFQRLWHEGEGWVNVEHDVLVRPDTLAELADCPHDWCAAPIPYLSNRRYGLGCVKFSDRLLEEFPDAIEQVAISAIVDVQSRTCWHCQAGDKRYCKDRHPTLSIEPIQLDKVHPPRHWCPMDSRISAILPRIGVQLHEHQELLGHYRDYEGIPQPTHGCSGSRRDEALFARPRV